MTGTHVCLGRELEHPRPCAQSLVHALLGRRKRDTQLRHHAARRPALGDVPDTITRAARLGRIAPRSSPRFDNGKTAGPVLAEGAAECCNLQAAPQGARLAARWASWVWTSSLH